MRMTRSCPLVGFAAQGILVLGALALLLAPATADSGACKANPQAQLSEYGADGAAEAEEAAIVPEEEEDGADNRGIIRSMPTHMMMAPSKPKRSEEEDGVFEAEEADGGVQSEVAEAAIAAGDRADGGAVLSVAQRVAPSRPERPERPGTLLGETGRHRRRRIGGRLKSAVSKVKSAAKSAASKVKSAASGVKSAASSVASKVAEKVSAVSQKIPLFLMKVKFGAYVKLVRPRFLKVNGRRKLVRRALIKRIVGRAKLATADFAIELKNMKVAHQEVRKQEKTFRKKLKDKHHCKTSVPPILSSMVQSYKAHEERLMSGSRRLKEHAVRINKWIRGLKGSHVSTLAVILGAAAGTGVLAFYFPPAMIITPFGVSMFILARRLAMRKVRKVKKFIKSLQRMRTRLYKIANGEQALGARLRRQSGKIAGAIKLFRNAYEGDASNLHVKRVRMKIARLKLGRLKHDRLGKAARRLVRKTKRIAKKAKRGLRLFKRTSKYIQASRISRFAGRIIRRMAKITRRILKVAGKLTPAIAKFPQRLLKLFEKIRLVGIEAVVGLIKEVKSMFQAVLATIMKVGKVAKDKVTKLLRKIGLELKNGRFKKLGKGGGMKRR